ncbi:MAG: hypothetical protein JNM07_15810 [Phycisphaerae bacterium]|nr:hypothetical protein [Phycisphaerae bacterium]
MAIIERAGIDAYAKPFHTLRKCCLSDWCERFAPAVVAEISGDRVETLMRHYVRARKSTVRAQMGTYQTLSTMQAEMEALKRENARLQGQIEGKSNPASAPS